VYANGDDLKLQLKKKYEKFSVSELKESAELIKDALQCNITLTVRLCTLFMGG
jgi:hypothetical protein